jgi:antitoxin component of MazEF toxin-antitoxin module
MTVETRRQGNSIMITIPASFNIGVNVEYEPVMDANGVISLVPVHHHLFDQKPDYDLRAAMEADRINDNGTPVGREDVWHDD